MHCLEGEVGGNCWEGSHAYNKGRNTVLVVSQVPLPNYRADLDDRHGSSQRQVGALPILYKYQLYLLTEFGVHRVPCCLRLLVLSTADIDVCHYGDSGGEHACKYP